MRCNGRRLRFFFSRASSGLIIRKPQTTHSRARVRARNVAKSKGRHTGEGKRKGKKGARMPQSVLWLRRVRVLRRLLKKYRAAGKIDARLYHDLYLRVKGECRFCCCEWFFTPRHQETTSRARRI